jgi:hypothetical protein
MYLRPEALVTVFATAALSLALTCSCTAITGIAHITDNTATMIALLLILILQPPDCGLNYVLLLTLSYHITEKKSAGNTKHFEVYQ